MMKFIGTAEQEYKKFSESDASVGNDKVMEAYEALDDAFEAYLCAVQENEWNNHYNYFMRMFLGGGRISKKDK